MAKKNKPEPKPKNVELVIVCTIKKIVWCEGCTVAEAEADPWKYAVDEQEAEMTNWDVKEAKEVS